METEITKIDAAVDQLDWAIRLILDHQAYAPAITLAGAAEELLGAMVPGDAVFHKLQGKAAADFKLTEVEVSQQYLNATRNWLKHWTGQKDPAAQAVDLEGEAVQYAVRALANLYHLDQSPSREGPRFFEWLHANGARLGLAPFQLLHAAPHRG
jgi:hypothetical protein